MTFNKDQIMKPNTLTLFKWLFLAIFSIIIYIFLISVFQPELYYHFQQPPFILDWNFFYTFLTVPGGISQYITNFLSQFFFYGWAGSLVILTLGLIMMFLTLSILKSFKVYNFSYFWMYIPFILLIAVTNNYYFPYVVVIKIILLYLTIWLFRLLLRKKINEFLLLFILAPAIYYLAGSGILMLFSATVLFVYIIDNKSILKILVFSSFIIIYTYLIARLSYNYVFTIAADEAYFSFYPDLPNYMKFNPGLIYYLFCYSLPLISLLILLYQKFMIKPVKKGMDNFGKQFFSNALVIYAFVCLIIAGSSYFIINSTINKHNKNVIKADYYCSNEKWNDVIDLAVSDTTYNLFINYNYNRAIDNSGHFLDMFFRYPQYMGINALYPDKINVPELSEISSDYYFDLGYISESQHWAYEALTIFPYSIRVLKRLVMTNLIYGNYEGAREYLEILNKNFLAKNFVKEFKPYVDDTTLVTKNSLIMEKRSFRPAYSHLSDSIINRFYDLLYKNDKNQRAYEHLQMSFLLDLDLGHFMENLTTSSKFYNQTPKVFEQAILMYLFMTGTKKINQFKINTNAQKTFAEYLKILRESNNNKELAKPSLSNYSNTYMFYTDYSCPSVTNALLTKENEQKY